MNEQNERAKINTAWKRCLLTLEYLPPYYLAEKDCALLRDCIPVPKAEYHRLRRALKSLQALVAALDVCKPAVDAAFTFQHAHGMDYRGPTYGVQLDSAREFAKEMEAAEMERGEKGKP